MSIVATLKKYALAVAVVASLAATDDWVDGKLLPAGTFVSEAQARIGRPLSARSVAGVARRTTRRTIRRSAIYVGALPRGCARATVSGSAVWRCGGTYYQSYGGRYAVVYID